MKQQNVIAIRKHLLKIDRVINQCKNTFETINHEDVYKMAEVISRTIIIVGRIVEAVEAGAKIEDIKQIVEEKNIERAISMSGYNVMCIMMFAANSFERLHGCLEVLTNEREAINKLL